MSDFYYSDMKTKTAVSGKEPVLEICHLSKKLSGKPILSDINITVYPGEIYGFLGPNGSGKTTTIKLVLGLLNIDIGNVNICGYNVKKDFEKAIANIGGIIENPELYRYLTGRENLMQCLRMYDGIPISRIDEVVKTVHLEGRINDKVSKYSLGMRQRLGVAQAILHSPKLLILDEPMNGLDPAGIKELREILIDLSHNHGVAVLISSHQLSELEQMCDRVGIIDRGMNVGEKVLSELASDGEGKQIYEIETDCVNEALGIARKIGTPAEAIENAVCLHAERTQIPTIVRELANGGVNIYGLTVHRKSLEEEFLERTHWNTPGATADEGGRVGKPENELDYSQEGGDVK